MTHYTPVQYLPAIDPAAIEKALMAGDLAKLDSQTRVKFYQALCQSTGLNPLTRPFILLKTQSGELHWYPTVGAAEQLRKLHRVSTKILSRESVDDLYSVVVEVSTPDGRREESEALVPIGSLKGLERANARMRCESKAKRRATLAICGLGMGLAEEESGQVVAFDAQTGEMTAAVESPPPPLLPVIGRWFRTQEPEHRERIAQAVWGTELRQLPHLAEDDLEAGWTLIDHGQVLLPWDSPTLAEVVQQWRKSRANEAIAELFDEETAG